VLTLKVPKKEEEKTEPEATKKKEFTYRNHVMRFHFIDMTNGA